MSTKKVELTQSNIYDASKAEIILFAASAAGIEFTGEESREYMISQTCAAMDWTEKDLADGATHVVVRLARDPSIEGNYAYRGGFNGRMFSIPREVDTEIPIEFYNTIVDSQNKGFTIAPLTKFKEGSPNEDRVGVSGVQMSVLRFLTKG